MCPPGSKKWLILGVNLTHLAESRDLFFLKAKIVDNIFKWDVLKNMRQIESYDDIFGSLGFDGSKILKIRIFGQKGFCKMEAFSVKCFDSNYTGCPKKGYMFVRK